MLSSRVRAAAGLSALILITLAVPVVIPIANAWRAAQPLPPTYLPALEGPRERGLFAQDRLPDLQRMQPGYVVIGDSMAGTRLDERRLVELTGVQVAPLLQPGSGSAFWYLALKNWVIASGIKPRMVLIFFRDTNLTDVMFRLDDQFRWALDFAALDREDALNAVVARRLGFLHRVHRTVDRIVGTEQARRRVEPAVIAWPVDAMMSSRRRQADFVTQMNDRLGLDHLRTMEAADIQTGEDSSLDFARDVEDSVLPLMLSDASRAGLTICFVRVQRRPTANRPPAQSPALRRYVEALQAYVTARGALFHDDTGDPALTIDMYEDGDHLARHARRGYTENLYNRLRPLPVIFHSLDFVAFFVAFCAIYWALPHRGQNLWLFAGSYFFYGYVHPWFLILIATSTVVDYCAARGMEAWPARRRQFLWLSVISNFGMLGFFKYFNFFVENVAGVLAAVGVTVHEPTLRILLPVGISFYTFQAMSYTIDAYRGELHARRSLLDLAVFVSFFPHLVAGPIQRASYLLPQVESTRRFSPERARSGFVLICWGFFKKLVVADNVGVIANKVFALSDPTFYILWAGVFAFAIQIYADFSAYTDIARGTSRWLGFELTENFAHPYMARSPTDFWRRWNISLSSWFRDYVYIPLGGSRLGTWFWTRNVLITFLLSGLWHGASWNYVLWGLYHGLLLLVTQVAGRLKIPERQFGRWVVVPQIVGMFALTMLGWLLFRETDLPAIIRDLRLSPFRVSDLDRQTGLYLFLLAFGSSVPLWIQSLWVEITRGSTRAEPSVAMAFPPWPRLVLQGVACGLALVAILVLRSRTSLDFIYFQF